MNSVSNIKTMWTLHKGSRRFRFIRTHYSYCGSGMTYHVTIRKNQPTSTDTTASSEIDKLRTAQGFADGAIFIGSGESMGIVYKIYQKDNVIKLYLYDMTRYRCYSAISIDRDTYMEFKIE